MKETNQLHVKCFKNTVPDGIGVQVLLRKRRNSILTHLVDVCINRWGRQIDMYSKRQASVPLFSCRIQTIKQGDRLNNHTCVVNSALSSTAGYEQVMANTTQQHINFPHFPKQTCLMVLVVSPLPIFERTWRISGKMMKNFLPWVVAVTSALFQVALQYKASPWSERQSQFRSSLITKNGTDLLLLWKRSYLP